MSLVDERLARESLPDSRRRDGQVPMAWAWGTAVAWVVGLQLMTVLEPRPLHPDAVPAVLVTALAFVLNGALLVAAVGLVRRARWALLVLAGAGFLNVGAVVACPISGHHQLGLWWFAQASIAVGLVVFSVVAWQRASLHTD